jgi:hypothetical protein
MVISVDLVITAMRNMSNKRLLRVGGGVKDITKCIGYGHKDACIIGAVE